ncbi:hypothetical protein EPUL_001592 [Erysiphe pulchra]|uniref:Uncharacterized protein n=1 Tax=Erysiphe pulchra TaxID=225359 RepID=A0A2S4PVG2_9PEZI|nr:hypothetical protein EPUL_001592 [Erysiphe pulchra]
MSKIEPLSLPTEAQYESFEALFSSCRQHAKQAGYSFIKQKLDRRNGRLIGYIACKCSGKFELKYVENDTSRQRIRNTHKTCKDKFEIQNAFLPKELAHIIATRLRRERAWHARLMICTTAISNIESTLGNLKDEVEREEVVAFKAYLRLAIAHFAAVDTSPAPPNGLNKVAIATPRTPMGVVAKIGKINEAPSILKIPKLTENTWATVARNGHKKVRVSPSTKTQVVSIDTIKDKSKIASPSNKDSSDKRLFIRLPLDHEWRKLALAGIREVIVKKLSISPSLIGRIKPVQSGFALSPCSSEARENMLKAGNSLFLSGAKLEPATNWVPILVSTVPATIPMEQGKVEISKSMLSDEIERVCSIRPSHLKLYGRNNPKASHRTWMAYFSKIPRGGFRVFDESGIARPYKKQQTLEFCRRFNGHHPSKNCSRAQSCGNCGSTNHTIDVCMATTKYRNCGVPHRADSRRCLAHPTHSGAPSKEQMKAYHQAGERECQAVQRARAVEEEADKTECIEIDTPSSQMTESSGCNDNIQANPVESSTGVASRL